MMPPKNMAITEVIALTRLLFVMTGVCNKYTNKHFVIRSG